MIHHVYANKSNIGDWLSALGIQDLLAPHPVVEHLCDRPFVPATLEALSRLGPEDLVVIGGGGLLMDYFEPFWDGLLSLNGVRFCLWGVGRCALKAEPSDLPASLLGEIANRAALCVLRDDLSMDILNLAVPPPVPCPSLAVIDAPEIDGWGILHVANRTTAGERAHESLKAAAQRFAGQTGRPYSETDNRLVSAALPALVEALEGYAEADVIASSALHGCVIAVAAGRKVIAVSGDHKIDEFMRAAGLEEWVVPADDLELLPILFDRIAEQVPHNRFVAQAVRGNREVARVVLEMANMPMVEGDGDHEQSRDLKTPRRRRDLLRRIAGPPVADGARSASRAWAASCPTVVPTAVTLLNRGSGPRGIGSRYKLRAGDVFIEAALVPSEAARIEEAALAHLAADESCWLVGSRRSAAAEGGVADTAGTWVFCETECARPLDPENGRDSALAARALGELHARTVGSAVLRKTLRSRSLDAYRAKAELAASRFGSIDRPSSEGHAALSVVLANWHGVAAAWEREPSCLVHGSWYPHNLRVAISSGGREALTAVGWEAAVWGVAAEDVDGTNADLYWPAVEGVLGPAGVSCEEHFALGGVLRGITIVEAWSESVPGGWIDDALAAIDLETDRVLVAGASRGWW